MENHLPIMTRKNNSSFSIKKNMKQKKSLYQEVEVHKKAVYANITRRGALSECPSIHTDKITAIKKY